MNKQQQLTYDKGISNIPSDILCDDNCLQESMNIVYRDGEHQPIQDPVKLCDDNGAIQILRVHKVGSSENFIALYNDGVLGYFQKGNNGTEFKQTLLRDVSQEGLMVEAIGKSIVVRTTDDLYYFIWSGTMYKDLGTSVPKPEHVELQTYSEDNVSFDSVSNIKRDWEFYPVEVCEAVDSWQFHDENTFVGYSQAARNKAYDRKYFVFPFMARYAVEMYDGSYIHVSNPIMMFPNVRGGFFYFITNDGDNDLCFHCHCSDLQFKVQYNLSDDWSDLVKGLVIFASLPVNTVEYKIIPDGFIFEKGFARLNWVSEGVNKKIPYTAYSHTTFPERPQKDIIKELVEQENFYKVAELYDVRNTSGWVSIKDYANSRISDPGILATQPRLSDSYMEENKKWPERIFSYNGRLVLANVKRALAPIGNMFAALNSNDDGIVREYEVYVNVQTDDGEKVEHNTISTPYALQYYFFYPDVRAKRVRIYEGTKKILDGGLTESSVLNGAYYAAGWLPDLVDEGETIEQLPTDYDSTPELLSNQLYVSEVNNPWKYNSSGNLTVGFGDIIGLSTQTTAISQGQFGQFPLLIFTTEGIYAASLNNEGVFTAVYPLSREVCNNPDSITQTDGAVFFSSNKGLMVVVGNDVRCVSEQLSGEFPNILKTAKIAYDYRDSLLWIASDINRDRILGEKCWVYNIKTGTFHKSSYFVGVNSGSGTKLTFNGFYSDDTPRRRVLPINSEPVPTPVVLARVYNKADLQAMVLDSLIGAIDTGGVSAFRQYQQVDDSIIYGRIRDTGGRTDLNRFYRYVSIFFAYPDGIGGFATRLYTKFENSDQYSTNSGQPRTDVLYYNNYYRFRWNGTRDGFDKVREFNGILAESPAEPTDTVEDGMLLGEEDGNDFDMIVPAGYSYNYGNKTIVFDPVRKRFILRWVQNYTKVDDSTTRDFTLYFKGSVLLNDYVDSTNNYHPKTDSVYQDTTNGTNYPLYRWYESNLAHIDNTNVTQLYRMSGTMEITLNDAYIIQHVEQGQTIETMSLRRGPIINCQEYDSGPYDEYDASRLQGHMKEVLMANLKAPDLDASANGVMFYTDGKKFVEQRSYSFVYNDTTYNGLMYYDTFQWGVGEAAPHRPSPDVLYVLNGTSYYAWDGNNLVPTFAGLANIVNNYPDTLFHKLGDGLYSLTERPQPEDDTNQYSGVIETRPMKLENGLALKSIMQLRNVCKMDGTVVLSMWGSNNLRSWVKLRAFRNAPWKYYRFRFEFSNMPATDRFAGTVLVTQERRTNKLR